MKNYFNRLKSEKKLTNQQIADMSGVSLSTVNRIMAGSAKNPSHEAVVSICSALGGDPNDLPNAPEPPHFASEIEHNETFVRVLEGYEQQFEREREAYEAQIRTKDRWIRALAIGLAVLVLFFITILLIDLFDPSIGWIRELLHIDTSVTKEML